MKGSHSQPRLKGKFITSGARKLVASEISKTHFNIGDAPADFTTTSQRMFAEPSEPPRRAEPSVLSRATHFVLKEPGKLQEVAGKTEAEWRYKAYDVSSAFTRPDEAIKDDLRKHHFKLGTTQADLKSTIQSTFTPQITNVDAHQISDIERLKHKIRTHSNIFGSGKMPAQGLSHEQFTPKMTESWDVAGERNAHRTRNQQANFRVGSYPMDYESVSAHDYPAKTSPGLTGRPHPTASIGIRLGTDRPDFATVSHSTFASFPRSKRSLNEEALADLRRTHFEMGTATCAFESTNAGLMKGEPLAERLERPSSRNRKSNFVFGADNPQWKTIYGLSHAAPKTDEMEKPMRDRHTDKQSHFMLGSDSKQMPGSVAMEDYKPLLRAEPNKLPAAITADIRQHHFQVGTEKPQWELVSQRYGAAPGVAAQIDPDRLKDITSEHFKLGFSSVEYGTSSASPVYKPGSRNKLDPLTLKKLKGTNAMLGTSTGEYNTTYGGAFLWVQPEPDSDFKLTMH